MFFMSCSANNICYSWTDVQPSEQLYNWCCDPEFSSVFILKKQKTWIIILYRLCMLPIEINLDWITSDYELSPLCPLLSVSWSVCHEFLKVQISALFLCFFAFLLFIGKVEQILWYIYLWWHKSRQHLLA